MKLPTIICAILGAAACESFSKSCFINYLLSRDVLDRSYQLFTTTGNQMDAKCELAVNTTITKIQAFSKDDCIAELLKKRSVSDTLLKEYLLPQLKGSQTTVAFDNRFEVFRNKTLRVTKVICNNRDIFKPDIKGVIKQGQLQKDAKSMEIKCVQTYIMVKNKPLEADCKKIVEAIKTEFYQKIETQMKEAFKQPNDKLVNLKCGLEKAKKFQFFEKFFFFVVLATTRNLNDKQIDVLLKNADGVIGTSTKLIFECMN